MTTFAQLFDLADPTRASFELSPEHDATLFIDLDDVIDWLEQRVRTGAPAPQLVVKGDFGTGKSHVLRHIEKKLAPERNIRPVYFQLGSFTRRSSFFDLHISVMGEFLEILENNLAQASSVQAFLQAQPALHHEIKDAIQKLADRNIPPDKRATVRSWLLGTGPTPTQARKEGFSGRLFERTSSVGLINLWKAVGELQRAVDGRLLLLLLDEGEAFSKMVSPDAQASMGSGLRTLFDPDNRSLGIALGLNTPTSRQGLHPMLQPDVASRLMDKELSLMPLGEPERVRRFIEGLWDQLRGPNAAPSLFDIGALGLVTTQLRDLSNAIFLRRNAPAPTPTQRHLMGVLRYIGELALRDGARPPFNRKQLLRWFQLGNT
ncbi:hypothetical protein [Sorangium sp. So ce1151]|uniref:hypothetical protein n=1 Tax=Sorangium sp. So ce1151 TaxID=3133332 RepID=UPI003F5E89DA